jgi:DNA-binding transcriptional ArsR family regulator
MRTGRLSSRRPRKAAAPEIPETAADLLAVVREPRRLAILLALEQQPRSAVDLSRDLDLAYDKVVWAVKALRTGGLIVLAGTPQPDSERPRGRGSDLVKVYEVRHQGWSRLVRTLSAIAATGTADE